MSPRLRGSLIAGFAAALTVSAPSGTLASPEFASSFDMRYSRQAPGSSAGIDARMTWSDPGEPGGKPRAISRIRFDFHPGTRLDTAALPRCRASNAEIRRRGAGACPRNSKVGSGGSTVNTGVIAPFSTRISLFNARRQIIVLVETGDTTLALFRDDVDSGAITVNLAIPSGFSLTELHVKLTPHSRRVAGRRKVYFRTPRSCPAGGAWSTTATFDYVDGFRERRTSTTPCA